jgi:hypothetical protein
MNNNKRTITRGQVRRREAGCEGRLWETCELMDKKCIQGRRRLVSWLHTAKPYGSSTEVNATVVQGSIAFLPGEASLACGVWFQYTVKDAAPDVAIRSVSNEESAEGIVVALESVSRCAPQWDVIKGIRQAVAVEGLNLMGSCQPPSSPETGDAGRGEPILL